MWKRFIRGIRGSLTARIFLITALMLGAACAFTFVFVAWAAPMTVYNIAAQALEGRTARLLQALEGTTLQDCGPLLDRFALETGASVLIQDQQGNSVDMPGSLLEGVKSVSEGGFVTITATSMAGDDAQVKTLAGLLGQPSVMVTTDWSEYPISFSGDEGRYTLMVMASATSAEQAVLALGRVAPALALGVLAISLLGAVLYSRFITRPIVRLSGISQRMAKLDFSFRCAEQRGDEIGALGRSLNELSDRLSAALGELTAANAALVADMDKERELERQRVAFFSMASHELKTPLTVLKGQLAGMLAGVDVYRDRDKYLARCLGVTARMEGLVQEILAVARMESADFVLKQEDVDLSALMQAQGEQAADLAAQRGQRLTVRAGRGVRVKGDGALLARAVGNLLTNALVHSPEGAEISASLIQEEGQTHLVVDNNGAHIPEAALGRVFEAFYRVDSSHSRSSGGSGLGLYLTQRIAQRHGARCEINNIPGGVRATLTFPQ